MPTPVPSRLGAPLRLPLAARRPLSASRAWWAALALVAALLVLLPATLASQSPPRPPGAAAGTPADTIARGRTIFASLCRSCHSVRPPAQGAPPMAVIARRYRGVAGSEAAARARIAAWLAQPDSARSLLPRDEVRRYGVMPHQPLADAGRFAVAAYVMTLADSMPRRGRGAR